MPAEISSPKEQRAEFHRHHRPISSPPTLLVGCCVIGGMGVVIDISLAEPFPPRRWNGQLADDDQRIGRPNDWTANNDLRAGQPTMTEGLVGR
jgi:hypothetical protein